MLTSELYILEYNLDYILVFNTHFISCYKYGFNFWNILKFSFLKGASAFSFDLN